MEGMNIYDVLLVDSDFKVEWNVLPGLHKRIENEKHSRHHLFTIQNAERSFKLGSDSDKKMEQFIQSIQMMRDITPWSKRHRFDSFAPVRHGVQAQWLVDGRDYFWNVSRAILKARDVIYIHEYALL
jgi:phospholipase D1/2